jgi:hypothetical protein
MVGTHAREKQKSNDERRGKRAHKGGEEGGGKKRRGWMVGSKCLFKGRVMVTRVSVEG